MASKLAILAESKFTVRCLERGYAVSQPLDPSAPYDRIIDVNSKLLRIQIKASERPSTIDSYQFTLSSGLPTSYAGKADFVVFHGVEHDWWFNVPVGAIKVGLTKVRMSNRNFWSKFLNNWDILEL